MRKLTVIATIITMTVFASFSFAATQVNYCIKSDVQTLDPHAGQSVTTFVPLTQIYDPLTQYNRTSKKLDPMLAINWTVSDDGLKYTFKLRKGVKWQSNDLFKPTRDFNADDVVFTVKSQLDDKSPYHYAGNSVGVNIVGWNKLVSDVVALDPYTVQFTLKRPMSTFLLATTYGAALIQSKEYAEAMLKKGDFMLMHKNPLGTGAFQFAGYEQDNYLRMTANKDYWGKKAKYDRLNFLVVKDKSVELSKVVKGECDFADNIDPKEIPAKATADSPLGTIKNSVATIFSLGLNVRHDGLSNVEVRRAIAYAINYDKIISEAYQGQGVRATSAVPSAIDGFYDKFEKFSYDPKKARDILLKAGVKPNTITLKYYSATGRSNSNMVGEILQANLKDVGINLETTTLEWGAFLDKAFGKGEADIIVNGWSAYLADPYSYLAVQYSCSAINATLNPSFYCSKEFDNLTDTAVVLNDPKKRNELYAKAQELLVSKYVALVPLVEPVIYTIYNTNRIKQPSFNASPYSVIYLNDYELK